MATKTYNKNQIIFYEGDSADCMFDIYFGSVGIYSGFGTENQKLLVKLTPDDCFGEMGLIDQSPRSATAVALEKETVLRVITEAEFGSFLEEKPAKALTIMQQMSKRIRGLTEDYVAACRAVTEAVTEEKPEKKTSWFKKNLNRFLKDHEKTAKGAKLPEDYLKADSDADATKE